MMDKTILDLTKYNKTQQENRQFIEGDPQAILMCEIKGETTEEVDLKIVALIKDIDSLNLSYANPILKTEDIDRAIELRKAGLGLLGNIIGDKKTAACIEDTAVALPDLANYIGEFTKLMTSYNQEAVYYAHAGAGRSEEHTSELQSRPHLVC